MPDNSIICMTPAEWTAQNPILFPDQIGKEIAVLNGVNTVPAKSKTGDGVTRWNDLPYWNPTGGGSDVFGPALSTVNAIATWNAADGTLLKNTDAFVDANNNIYGSNVFGGAVSILTSATPVVLTVASKGTQVFTGSTAQTVTLPVVTTLPQTGAAFLLINDSSASLTVNSSGANLVQTVTAGSRALVTCVLLTGTTAASWAVTYISAGASVTWGTITGTLSAQTDLQAALNAKLNATSILRSYLATTVTYNDVDVLADSPLTVTVQASAIYAIELVVQGGGNSARSLNMDFGGTATVTNFIGQWSSSTTDGSTQLTARSVAAGTDYNDTALDGLGDTIYRFIGSVEITTSGTFLLRAAQNAANATNTSILRGSTLILTQMA